MEVMQQCEKEVKENNKLKQKTCHKLELHTRSHWLMDVKLH
jgi:hypothetical protein